MVSNVWQTSSDAAGTSLLLSHCVVTNGGVFNSTVLTGIVYMTHLLGSRVGG